MAGYLSHFFGIGIPAMLVFLCLFPYRHRALDAQSLISSPLREGLLHLFVLCLFGLAAMVLWPGYHFEPSNGLWGNLVIHNARTSWRDNLSLIPLRMVADYLQAFREGELFYAIVMLFGNLGTFLPLGFFPALLFRGFGWKKTFFFGLAYSLGAECCQFFLGRHCDVDDVLLNVTGVMLGYVLFSLLKKLFPDFRKKCLCQIK
jgi:glycopeptide antibiotics resistance protein